VFAIFVSKHLDLPLRILQSVNTIEPAAR